MKKNSKNYYNKIKSKIIQIYFKFKLIFNNQINNKIKNILNYNNRQKNIIQIIFHW